MLFAHGAREAEWARPFEQIRDRLRASGLRVELAFLESMSPTLAQAAALLAAEQRREITIVPLFLSQGGHLKYELPRLVQSLRDRYAGVRFEVTAPLGDAAEVIDAIARWVQRAAQPDRRKPPEAGDIEG